MTISSLKDLGYQQAKTGDTLETQAQFALDNIAGFPEDVPSEAKDAREATKKARKTSNKNVQKRQMRFLYKLFYSF